MKKKLTHLDYCQFLLVSQVNYTQTYFADHSELLSHDRINRMMRQIKLTPQEWRQRVRSELRLSENGYILFDDTVLDKRHSTAIESVRRQWSGNEKRVIKGIGIVRVVHLLCTRRIRSIWKRPEGCCDDDPAGAILAFAMVWDI